MKIRKEQLKTATEGLKAFEGVDVKDLRGQVTKLTNSSGTVVDAYDLFLTRTIPQTIPAAREEPAGTPLRDLRFSREGLIQVHQPVMSTGRARTSTTRNSSGHAQMEGLLPRGTQHQLLETSLCSRAVLSGRTDLA